MILLDLMLRWGKVVKGGSCKLMVVMWLRELLQDVDHVDLRQVWVGALGNRG